MAVQLPPHSTNGTKIKHWLHQASVSALTLASTFEKGYDTNAWCGLYRYKSMWAITSVNVEGSVWPGPQKSLNSFENRSAVDYLKQHLTDKCFPFSILIDVSACVVWSVL